MPLECLRSGTDKPLARLGGQLIFFRLGDGTSMGTFLLPGHGGRMSQLTLLTCLEPQQLQQFLLGQ